MGYDNRTELYQQVILEHNKKPRNFKELSDATHKAEGYNPLCGDHLYVYLHVNDQKLIDEVSFTGEGCAISKAAASMMTQALKGKSVTAAEALFEEYHRLVNGKLDPDKEKNNLGHLAIFSNIWHFPARVKCAVLCWHTMKGALAHKESVSTE